LPNPTFWRNKRVFLTGHTGFKGGWLAAWLRALDARVAGYGLAPETSPSFFESCRVAGIVESTFADVRDAERLTRALSDFHPEIVFHLAAQPIVRRSYRQPVETVATNIMGTTHLLEAARHAPSVRAVVVVTSDKCYHNRGWLWGYREDEPMGGRDPYSASKGCAELISAAYQHSFFRDTRATVATARAGNVIGGGDWSEDRIVPDAVRALAAGRPIHVRSPRAVRPWQHVLEPVSGYLLLAEKVYDGQRRFEGGWNFGPGESSALPVSNLSDLLVGAWGNGARWEAAPQAEAPHEETYLKLDSSKARHLLGWRPALNIQEAVEWTVAWYRQAVRGEPMYDFTARQIACYQERL
jgi:CDP-glucose 4,6-dehydratase